MEMTLFDLMEVIKDTDKPILITRHNTFHSYTYRELAIDDELLSSKVAALQIDVIDGVMCYIIKIRR